MKVSIIIPIYNCEKYLSECLDSVLEQTLQEIEVVCVNDGSKDSSEIILKDYARKDKRIKIICNETNKGLSYSRNKGMDIAKGEYLIFLDSDDMFMTNSALLELYNKAETKKADLIFFDSEMCIENEEILDKERKRFCSKVQNDEIMSGIEYFLLMQRENNIRVPVWLQFWNRSFLEATKIKFLDGALHEDYLFTYMALIKTPRVLNYNKTFHIYRRHNNTISLGKLNSNHIRSLLQIYRLIEEYRFGNRNKKFDAVTTVYLNKIKMLINKYIADPDINIENLEEEWGESSPYSYMLEKLLEPQPILPIKKKKVVNLLNMNNIYIYGAGKVAKKCYIILMAYGIRIEGFVVADLRDNPAKILDAEVCDIMSLLPVKDDSTILIGVGRKLQGEVIDTLDKLGFHKYELLY